MNDCVRAQNYRRARVGRRIRIAHAWCTCTNNAPKYKFGKIYGNHNNGIGAKQSSVVAKTTISCVIRARARTINQNSDLERPRRTVAAGPFIT